MHRRLFLLKMLAAASAAMVGCTPASEQPDDTATGDATIPPTAPTLEPTQAATPTAVAPAPTATVPPPAPEQQVSHLDGIIIRAPLLQSAFADSGGEWTALNLGAEASTPAFDHDYASASWRAVIEPHSLAEQPVEALKFLLSLADYLQQEGFIQPGMWECTLLVPALENAYFCRVTLEHLPDTLEQLPERAQDTRPNGLTVSEGSVMTVIGSMEQTAQEAVARAADPNAPHRVLVSFTDPRRASAKDPAQGAPFQHLAVIPSHAGDSEGEPGITLAELLDANGYRYHPVPRAISRDDPGRTTIWELNQIRGDELNAQLIRKAGLYYIGEMQGEIVNSPVVPYPEELPVAWEVETIEEADGTRSVHVQDLGKPAGAQSFGIATYRIETERWEWQLALPDMLQVIDRDGEQFQVVEANGIWEEILLLEGLTLTWMVDTDRWEYVDVDGERVAYWIAPQTEEGQGRVEITYPLSREGLQHLDFEKHRGLFSTISAQEAWRAFQEQFDQDEQLSITLPLNISNGGVVEQKKVVTDLLGFRELPKNTIIVSPISGPTFEASFGMNMPHALAYYFENDKEFFAMVFPKLGKFLVEGRDVLIGQPTINLQGDTFGPDFSIGLYKNYQLHLIDPRSGQGIAFDNLTKDSFGRITYLAGD